MDSKGKLTGSTANRDEYGSATADREPRYWGLPAIIRYCIPICACKMIIDDILMHRVNEEK